MYLDAEIAYLFKGLIQGNNNRFFRVQVGFRVQGLGLRVWDLGLRG